MESELAEAREAVLRAEALLAMAGAGMGVDSGLPDFRGDEGFWNAYPPYRRLGFRFVEMASPDRFAEDPSLGWGFYGHRLALYRAALPHAGFRRLLEFGGGLPGGHFVFTSNVDGQFQAAGFDPDRIVECHGSIHWLQCTGGCAGVWPGGNEVIEVDESTMRASDPLPACPQCGGLARPNILMFGDFAWRPERVAGQEQRFQDWLQTVLRRRLVIVECGAGSAVPTVRMHAEDLARRMPNATLIRINPREPAIPASVQGGIEIRAGAEEALEEILA